jgi:hypothetical protein
LMMGAEVTLLGFSRQTVTRMFEEERGRSHHGAPGVRAQARLSKYSHPPRCL